MDASKELQEVLKVLADQFGTTVSHVIGVLFSLNEDRCS